MPRGLVWSDIALGEPVGEGQSGVVFRATLRRAYRGLEADSVVAVKRYKRWVFDQPDQMERIFREADTGRRLRHENVVEIYGAVAEEGGRPALVMRLYDGKSLERILNDARLISQALSTDFSFDVLRGLASALVALHEIGIIHRDVKPGNVIVTEDGPVLTDFGVVRSQEFPEQTTTGSFLGTIRYAAPEYLFGEFYDKSVDLYGWGAIAYELFTGREAFGEYSHWARVVAARATGERGVTNEELDEIAARTNYNIAALVGYVVRHSRCNRSDRILDLRTFVEAADARAWTGSYNVGAGRISVGEKTFYGMYRTAQAAASALRDNLTTEDLRFLCDLTSANFWTGRVTTIDLPQKRIQKLIAAHAIERRPRSADINIRGCIREAFALGLL